MKRIFAAALAAGLVLPGIAPAAAADITLLCSNALKSVVDELHPQFEKSTGHKLMVVYNPTGPLKAQIEKGQAFDVAILGSGATDELVKQGKLKDRVDIARSALGVVYRKGAAKPDIATSEKFKQALLAARSVAFLEAGLTAAHLKGVLQNLGITDAVKAKAVYARAGEAVAEGKAEIGITQISEILSVPGAELAGPLPDDIQERSVFPAAVAPNSKAQDAAKALIKFLTSPQAAKVIKAKGLEPAR